MTLTAGLLLVGCADDGERAQVRRYLDAVNAIERAAAPEVERANNAYRSYARGQLPAHVAVVRLRGVDIRLRAVRERLAGLTPPERARSLHRRIGALYSGMSDFTQQTAVLAGYQAGAETVLEVVPRHNRSLRSGLARARAPEGQAAALRRFAGRIASVVRDLRNLDVPRVLAVSHEDQVRRLAATASIARRLRRALLAGDSPRVARLLERFSGDPGGRPRRRLARKAVTGYNERARALSRSYQSVLREFNLLDRVLG